MRQPPGAARPVSFLTAEAKRSQRILTVLPAAEAVGCSDFRATNAIAGVWGRSGNHRPAGRLEPVLLVPRAVES
jgi:hypothetical protein